MCTGVCKKEASGADEIRASKSIQKSENRSENQNVCLIIGGSLSTRGFQLPISIQTQPCIERRRKEKSAKLGKRFEAQAENGLSMLISRIDRSFDSHLHFVI